MIPVLIPIINGKELTRACIKTVLAQDMPTEAWILDNGATDGSAEMLRAWVDPRVHYIAARKSSVSSSWNFGLRHLFSEYDRVLVLNNDTMLRPDAVRLLVAEQSPFVTCVSRDDKDCLTEPLKPQSEWNRRLHPDFSCFMISKKCYQNVGEFDEKFLGAYAEDADYHIRMHNAVVLAYCIDVPFYHLGAGTIKSSVDAEPIQKRADANRTYFKEKWGVEVGSPEYYRMFANLRLL